MRRRKKNILYTFVRPAERAYTLLELLVAVTLLSMIVVGLYHVFNYTQLALRANVNQVDALETSRAVLETLRRDFAMMSPAPDRYGTNFHIYLNRYAQPMVISLSPTVRTTNWFFTIYLLKESDDRYEAVSYWIKPIKPGLGTLTRYSTNVVRWTDFARLCRDVETAPRELFVPLLDGVVHFRITAYDNLGIPLLYQIPEVRDAAADLEHLVVMPAATGSRVATDQSEVSTKNGLLPVSVDIELGILERSAVEAYMQLPSGSYLESRFLSDHAGQIHLFRQRILIPQGNLKLGQ